MHSPEDVMSEHERGGIHWSFWLIGVVALVWNVLGCLNFVSQMDTDSVAGLNPIGAAIGSMMQVVVSVFLVWYSRWAGRRGWAIRSRGEA